MNKDFEKRLGSALISIQKWVSLDYIPSVEPYKEIYEDMLPLLKKHGFVDSWTIGETIDIRLATIPETKAKYPTVTGANPNVNIMRGVESFLREFQDLTYEKTKHIDPGTFEKVTYRQCARDMVNIFQLKGLIADFKIGEGRKIVPQDPSFFLSKKQLATLARKQEENQNLSM